MFLVREHIPLEQGLRPGRNILIFLMVSCQRAYSIRTRIKTDHLVYEFYVHDSCQRAYSIRTRIKTAQGRGGALSLRGVREHIPLEQGLRRIKVVVVLIVCVCVREHIPLEQGLRPRRQGHRLRSC